jgi:hypothetical protein
MIDAVTWDPPRWTQTAWARLALCQKPSRYYVIVN